MTTDALITTGHLDAEAEDAATFLRALANPQRLRLVCALMDGERGVGELEQLTGIRQPTLSKELGKLRDSGVISGRRESKSVYYTLIEERAAAIIGVICGAAAPPIAGHRAPRREGGSLFARILPPKNA